MAAEPSYSTTSHQTSMMLAPRSRHVVQLPVNGNIHGQEIGNTHDATQSHTVIRSVDQEQNAGLILKSQQSWRLWPEMSIKVSGLHPSITTWDLWENFSREGTVVFIELFENTRGDRDGKARVRFSPPPHRDFWSMDNVVVSMRDGKGVFQVKIALEPKKRNFQIRSPVRRQVWYPEQLTLYSTAIRFGMMQDENTMMSMNNTFALCRQGIKFTVDLLRRRVVITFQLSPGARSPDNDSSEGEKEIEGSDSLVNYMLIIPLGQLEKIQKVDVSDTQGALVISLESPPSFFRKRIDTKASHTEAVSWSEFDNWYRQTAIVDDPELLKKAVVSLNKDSPLIDIGRWTSYHITFENSKEHADVFEIMENALQDYNIEVTDLDPFKLIPGEPALVWSLIDPPKSGKVESEMNVSQDLDSADRNLPFAVRYQLEVCISQGFINEYSITAGFLENLSSLSKSDPIQARYMLEYVADQGKRVYDPLAIFSNVEALAYAPRTAIPHYCAYTRKVNVTPSTLYYSSPAVEISNRVMRKFAEVHGDRFLRVQFTDEKFEGRINSCADKARNDEIFTRIYRTLRNGILIGGRHYEFLAFGNSQFRENGAYFFSPTEHLSCADIRRWMGDFSDIKVVAKYAARLGLCFSTTRAIHSSGVRIVPINDVSRNGYCFTDGVGKISDFLSLMIASELGLPPSNPAPSAFQFRMGGAKGILVNWPEAKGQEVHIRESQSKFKAVYNGLEIIRCSSYSPATLNRQTIAILSCLGVEDKVFRGLLSNQLANYREAMKDKDLALSLLGRYIDENHITMTIATMILDGFMETQEPFLLSLLHLWRAWSIKLLKEKARIIIEDGAFLLGVTDETGTLRGHTKDSVDSGRVVNVEKLPQVFIQVPSKDKEGSYVIIEGTCLLGRNPSLFPGDIRMVQAVDNPALHHLRDVVVFSQQGERDIPNMCSGGDLDGDDFFCIWDKSLTPTEWNSEPMNYSSPKPKTLCRPVEIQDVMRFFVRFMKNDALPTIAHAHLAQADYLENGVKDSKCLDLARLHSKAVDYVKTGEAAQMQKRLKPRTWPHFMEKKYKSKEQIYISKKILGQLYDMVESVNFVPQYEANFDPRILKAYPYDVLALKRVRQLKTKYDTAVRRIMAQYEIETEFEVWSTFVLSKPRVGSDYKVQEEMASVSGALKDRFRKICIEEAGDKSFERLGPFVAGMYRVTYEEMQFALYECRTTKTVGGKQKPKRKMEPKSMPLISFPWLFHEVLGRIATGLEQREGLEALGMSFSPTQNPPKRPHAHRAGIDELDFDDYVETSDGVTHRGEVLDLFRSGDTAYEGDESEQADRADHLRRKHRVYDARDSECSVALTRKSGFLERTGMTRAIISDNSGDDDDTAIPEALSFHASAPARESISSSSTSSAAIDTPDDVSDEYWPISRWQDMLGASNFPHGLPGTNSIVGEAVEDQETYHEESHNEVEEYYFGDEDESPLERLARAARLYEE